MACRLPMLVLAGLMATRAAGQSTQASAPWVGDASAWAFPPDEHTCLFESLAILMTYVGADDRIAELSSSLRGTDASARWSETPRALARQGVIVRERLLSPRELREFGDYAICCLRAEGSHGHFVFFSGSDGPYACFLDRPHFQRHEFLRVPFAELGSVWDGLALVLDRQATAAALEPPSAPSGPVVLAVGVGAAALAWLTVLLRRSRRARRAGLHAAAHVPDAGARREPATAEEVPDARDSRNGVHAAADELRGAGR